MESALHGSNFPPLSTSSPVSKIPSSLKDWCNIFSPAQTSPTSKSFSFSHHPLEPEVIPFSSEKLVSGSKDWSLCLVGYSIGRRPFYEALLGAINKTWSLKGSLKLHSLSDGFFSTPVLMC
ncbi:hypothetical protein MA16_Dca004170 [Dendrobium catenatum]|uniref:DUF4283 domain-containing protein n=1 Tax=Dendrobium catenatum TaxID=906689 RepID=A0A2I0X2M7_9ASPA|nr:hypothetical protein MA16_Dca004170 [Dendrobium catenatum]